MKIAVNGEWLCTNIDEYFPFLPAYISLFSSHSLKTSHSPLVLNLCESSSYYYRSNLSSPFTARLVCPALGPLPALREEVLLCLAMVHLCVTTKTSGKSLSERSLCLKFSSLVDPASSYCFQLTSQVATFYL